MQFLRTVFWVVLAIVGVIFAINNSHVVTIVLWSNFVADMPVWVVALVAFLAGLLPTLLLHRATRWRLRRRLDTANRALSEARAPAEQFAAAPPPAPSLHATIPPGGL